MRMFIDLARSRRTSRRFSSVPLSDEEKKLILEAGSLAPSSRGLKPVRLFPLDDRSSIEGLAGCRPTGTAALETASFAVIVTADSGMSDTWVEDSSIASIMMQLEAEDLGLGSCWIQVRMRGDGNISAESFVRNAIGIDEDLSVLCILAFGRKP